MRNRGVTRARLIATEACRTAENSADFLARVSEEVGLDLESSTARPKRGSPPPAARR